MKFSIIWDLDRFYVGGSHSKELSDCLNKIENGLCQLEKNLKEQSHLPSVLELFQALNMHLRQVSAFTSCLNAQDVNDTAALCLQSKITELKATFTSLSTILDEWLLTLSNADFSHLIKGENEIAFSLQERRTFAKEKLPAKDEALITTCAIDGYHGWTQLWDSLIRDLSFPYREDKLSFSQIENHLSSANREDRKEAFQSIETSLSPFQNTFASALNYLAGFRLQVYKKRNWESPLYEALHLNRIKAKTLDTMWSVVENNKKPLLDYLDCKAGLLKQKNLDWYDLEAPLSQNSRPIPYEEAASFLIENFHHFSPKFSHFTKTVLQDSWIDAENRSGKGVGGFCTAFPLNRESRIFLTYSNTITNVFTLAHELGHAFHNSLLFPLPEMAQHCRMNLAETASTMSEMIITQAIIAKASNKKEKLSLLNDHLNRSVSYLLNIHARFLFECDFYSERKKGFVEAKRLNALMQKAQEKSYQKRLGKYHPLFWAAKMHFYFTSIPFYNFPYTFGYLFSLGIYALSKESSSFEKNYLALLRDTGKMKTEDLAKKHLDVDLTQPFFWELAMKNIHQDVASFTALAEEITSVKSSSFS